MKKKAVGRRVFYKTVFVEKNGSSFDSMVENWGQESPFRCRFNPVMPSPF